MERSALPLWSSALLSALVVSAGGPVDAQEADCYCASHAGWTADPPVNARLLFDDTRYDLSTFQLWLGRRIGFGEENTPVASHFEPFFETGTQVLVPDEPLLPDRSYGGGALHREGYPEDILDLGVGFTVKGGVDTTPPQVGDLRVTGEVFRNDCGAHALVVEDSGTRDDRAGLTVIPVLVTLVSDRHEFQTVTNTSGNTSGGAFSPVIIGKAPLLRFDSCLTNEGLETLPFQYGEDVEVTMVVYDYAGNASAPVRQTIEWPIRRSAGGCSAARTPFSKSLGLVLAALVVAVLARARTS